MEIQSRCSRARGSRARGDVTGLVVHGQSDARFSDTIEFRDDLDFGPNVQRIGDYLREQDKRLKQLQASIRASARNDESATEGTNPVRIAEDLLDRIVVQRSRALCKEIESQQASNVELLFRPDADEPERLYYSDEYDGIKDALARFLPLFEGEVIETLGWLRVSVGRMLNRRMFVAQVEGKSMDDGRSGLVDGGYAVFELWPSGTRQFLNVLVRGAFSDPETGSYAVKKYVADERDEEGRHRRIALVSLNPDKEPGNHRTRTRRACAVRGTPPGARRGSDAPVPAP